MALCCLVNGSSHNKCSVCGCHLCYRCAQLKLRKPNEKYQKALHLLKDYYKFVDGRREMISIKVIGLKEGKHIIRQAWQRPLYGNVNRTLRTTDKQMLISLCDQVWRGYRYRFKIERLCQSCARKEG